MVGGVPEDEVRAEVSVGNVGRESVWLVVRQICNQTFSIRE